MTSLIRSWCLGEKYTVPEFQDLVMLELLKITQNELVGYEMVKFAFENTPDQSPLRKFMAKEAALRYYEQDGRDIAILGIFDNIQGFIREFMAWVNYKMDECENQEEADALYTHLDEPDEWKQYMVGGGPKKHWICELEG